MIKSGLQYRFSRSVFMLSVFLMVLLYSFFIVGTYLIITMQGPVWVIAVIWGVGLILFLDSGPRFLRIGKRIIAGEPGMILTRDGLKDFASNLFIQWMDISGIDVYHDKNGGEYVAVQLRYPEFYNVAHLSFWERGISKINQRRFNGLLHIRLIQFEGDKKELLEAMESFWNLYGKMHSFNLIFTEKGMYLSSKKYESWREIQDEYQDYKASLNFVSLEEVKDYLKVEYRLSAAQVNRMITEFESDGKSIMLRLA